MKGRWARGDRDLEMNEVAYDMQHEHQCPQKLGTNQTVPKRILQRAVHTQSGYKSIGFHTY